MRGDQTASPLQRLPRDRQRRDPAGFPRQRGLRRDPAREVREQPDELAILLEIPAVRRAQKTLDGQFFRQDHGMLGQFHVKIRHLVPPDLLSPLISSFTGTSTPATNTA